MENKMQVFENEMFGEMRALVINGEPWIVVQDILTALNISNRRSVIAHVDNEDKGYHIVSTLGGNQKMLVVNESGLYAIIMSAEPSKAAARGASKELIEVRTEHLNKFKRWVTHDVLPTIRKTGGYVNNSELFVNTYFPALTTDQKVLIHGLLENGMRQQALIAEMKPKAEFAEMVQASEGTLSMSEFAKLLCDTESIQIGRNKLCKLFRDKAVFCQDNKPRQEYVERNYFEVVETIKNGKPRTASRITGRGQIWATKKIKEWLA